MASLRKIPLNTRDIDRDTDMNVDTWLNSGIYLK